MAEEKTKPGRAQPQSDDTKVEKGRANAAPGEIDPSADQGNREQQLAAQLAAAPVKTLDMKKEEDKKSEEEVEDLSPREAALKNRQTQYVDEDGTTKYIDPDEFEEVPTHEQIPTDVCLNCKHHGVESKLSESGFCTNCGFKLNRIANMQLEPKPRSLTE